MLCTGLLEQQEQPLYFPLLDPSPSPSVRGLQLWIQRAWEDGQAGHLLLRIFNSTMSKDMTKLDVQNYETR